MMALLYDLYDKIMYGGLFYDLTFGAIAVFTILMALGVVLCRNIVHSALLLVLTFLGVAAVYFQLGSGFIGLVQILVYAGAISVLMIFAVMLVMDRAPSKTNLAVPGPKRRMAVAYIILLLTVFLGISVGLTDWPVADNLARASEVEFIANLLMGDYVVAFEVAAVLLLVAVVGAIMLAKGAGDK